MHFQLAGSGVMSAFYPHESELSRRVKQLIRAAKKQLEALCAMKQPLIMACSTFNPLTLQKYQPDPEDLCSLCGGNHGKAAMIECKDKIHICLNCVDVLVDIKNEREDKKRSEAIRALDSWMRDGYSAAQIYDLAISKGEIPGVRIE